MRCALHLDTRSFLKGLAIASALVALFAARADAATLTSTAMSRAGADLTVLAVAADAGKTDKFTNDGVSFIYINNGGGSPITVTLNWGTGATVDGQTPTARTVSVTNGHAVLIGPFPTGFYSDSNGFMSWTYSAVTSVTVAVVKPGN
jgi:hypothetical protein